MVLFALWFLWWLGKAWRRRLGSFRLTLYFSSRMIGTRAAFLGRIFPTDAADVVVPRLCALLPEENHLYPVHSAGQR